MTSALATFSLRAWLAIRRRCSPFFQLAPSAQCSHVRIRILIRSLNFLVSYIIFIMSSSVPTPLMSQTSIAAEASSRFQAIFQTALESYQKQTKKDLLAHPLASQLKVCDSNAAILAILQDQVQEFDKSRSGDERLTKWLGPTVNVLCAFSATISGGVSLVRLAS